jgi:endoglycosylceramidase
MGFCLIFLLAPALAFSESKIDSKPLGIHVAGIRFVDDAGREVILRGANAGGRSKMPPFFPFDPTPDFDTALNKYADGIQSLGFNVVRLIVIYEAGEPVRGKYDEDYLKHFDQMVRAFSGRGVYMFIDAHQDLFSRRLCGDGFPDWALPEKYRSMPQHNDCGNWGYFDFKASIQNTLKDFWADKDNVQESYAAFFKMLAQRYKDEPAIIGFEPINEPFMNFVSARSVGGFYKRQLFPLYVKVGDAVHSVDPRFLVFADIFPGENLHLWSANRPKPKISNLVFAPHYYDLGTYGKLSESGFEKSVMRSSLSVHSEQAKKWDAPMLVGEYGISPLNKGAAVYISNINSVFDELKASATFWEASMSPTIWNYENTSVFNPDGTVRPEALALDRPYPRAVAGKIKAFAFNPKQNRFEMTWEEDAKISAATEIYLPERIFGAAPKISLTPAGAFDFDHQSCVLKIKGLGSSGVRKVVIEK